MELTHGSASTAHRFAIFRWEPLLIVVAILFPYPIFLVALGVLVFRQPQRARTVVLVVIVAAAAMAAVKWPGYECIRTDLRWEMDEKGAFVQRPFCAEYRLRTRAQR